MQKVALTVDFQPFQDPLNIFSVVTVFRRYHTRYHSSVASLLYLVDLHVIIIEASDI